MRLSDFSALTFDVYGTLIDWETGMVAGLQPLTSRVEKELARNQILESHARYESGQQAQTPGKKYNEILAIVYKRLADLWGVEVTWEECKTYGQSVEYWPAFPDSVEALQYLKKHFKLVVLSNVDNESFVGSNNRLGVNFDAVYTAEDVGSYKPSDCNFEYMIDRIKDIGIKKHEILHTAESMFHDHKPANKFGLNNCWIYRRHDKEGFGATMHPGDMPTCDFQFNSMGELAEAHKKEMTG